MLEASCRGGQRWPSDLPFQSHTFPLSQLAAPSTKNRVRNK